MRRFYYSFLATIFLSSLAQASFTVDHKLHATFVGTKRIDHSRKVLQEMPERMYVHYDGRLPADKKLRYSAKGQLTEFICPVEAGVVGMERPLPMGVYPIFMPLDNPTQVEVLSAVYEGQTIGPIAGRYERLAPPVVLSSVLQNCKRINTLRIRCGSGLDDGMPVLIEYRETYDELVQTWSANLEATPVAGFDHVVQNPNGAALPSCFTFSCWYKNTGPTENLNVKTLLELQLKATETLVKDQTQVLRFGVATDTAHPSQLYVALQGSKDCVREERVKTGTKSVLETAAAPEKFTMLAEPVYRTINMRGIQTQVQDYDVKDTPITLDNGTKKWYWKNEKAGTVWLNGHQLVLIGGNKYGSFYYRDITPKTKQVKKVLKKAVPAVHEIQDVFENKTIHELKTSPLTESWLPLDGWMSFVMHVNAATKIATVFCNGTQILTAPTNFAYCLNGPFSCSIGARQSALLAEVHLIHGQLVPASKFCVRNSLDQVVPVKFEGPYGPNGCSLPQRQGNPAPPAAKAPPAKEPTQPAAAKAPPATKQAVPAKAAAKAPAKSAAKAATKAPVKAPGAPKQAPKKAVNKVPPVRAKK